MTTDGTLLPGGGTTTESAVTYAPQLSPWEVMNARNRRKAQVLQDNPCVAEAVDKLIDAVMLYCETTGIRTDEARIQAMLTRNGEFVMRIDA